MSQKTERVLRGNLKEVDELQKKVDDLTREVEDRRMQECKDHEKTGRFVNQYKQAVVNMATGISDTARKFRDN
jgi:hypothetical protein